MLKTINLKLPEEKKEQLKQAAKNKDLSIRQVMLFLVDYFILNSNQFNFGVEFNQAVPNNLNPPFNINNNEIK